MTVKELIEELQKADPTYEVVLECKYCDFPSVEDVAGVVVKDNGLVVIGN